MNGTDWPSPAANLAIVEQQIKKILAATGVDVPSLAIGLPLYFLFFFGLVEILIAQDNWIQYSPLCKIKLSFP